MTVPYQPFDLSPLGGQAIDAVEVNRFKWGFRDPNINHTQNGYYIEYKENVLNAPVKTTYWVTDSNPFYDFPLNTFTNGKNYAWRVKLKDSTTGTNLLTPNQSNFEYSTDGWKAVGSTITLTTTPVWEGTTSLKVTTTSAGDNYVYTPYYFTVNPSTSYTFSAYLNLLATIVGGYVRLRVIQRNASGTVLADTVGIDYSAVTSGWVRPVYTFTTNASAKTVELRLSITGVGTAYFDGIQFEKSSSVSAFQTGSLIESPFSDWVSFKCSSKPQCTITYPYSDNDLVASDIPTFSHLYADNEGTGQKSYQYNLYYNRNLLSQNQAIVETDLTGFGATGNGGVNAVLSRDTTTSWQGDACLKVVASGTQAYQGFYANISSSNFIAGATYTFSCYMKGNGNLRLICYQLSPSIQIGTSKTMSLTNNWVRYTVTVTLPNPLVNTTYGIRVDTGVTAQACTWYVDGLQVEMGSTADSFLAPNDTSALIWSSEIFTDQNNLAVMPKSILRNNLGYGIEVTVSDMDGLSTTSTRRIFYTNWTGTTSNTAGFSATPDNANSKMDLKWSAVKSNAGRYVGTGQRYKTCKYGVGIEVSQLGEKVYWDMDIPDVFTLTNWFLPNSISSIGTILMLYKDDNNYIKFGYNVTNNIFYIEKCLNGYIRIGGSPTVSLVAGQPIFYCLKQNLTGLVVYTGVNNVLTKWGA